MDDKLTPEIVAEMAVAGFPFEKMITKEVIEELCNTPITFVENEDGTFTAKIEQGAAKVGKTKTKAVIRLWFALNSK